MVGRAPSTRAAVPLSPYPIDSWDTGHRRRGLVVHARWWWRWKDTDDREADTDSDMPMCAFPSAFLLLRCTSQASSKTNQVQLVPLSGLQCQQGIVLPLVFLCASVRCPLLRSLPEVNFRFFALLTIPSGFVPQGCASILSSKRGEGKLEKRRHPPASIPAIVHLAAYVRLAFAQLRCTAVHEVWGGGAEEVVPWRNPLGPWRCASARSSRFPLAAAAAAATRLLVRRHSHRFLRSRRGRPFYFLGRPPTSTTARGRGGERGQKVCDFEDAAACIAAGRSGWTPSPRG
ncbi:hypothetical protein HPB50_020979 [Hyalomma asiaticum]|uniref:Uncharacterized protein n=1 Tax=Hyalomma asiaticum TaxID=266040 RepID=A0ACB7T3T2_HYAAI|nr:hypothetical protein HPB50_020979 [Hyalomma asiaticum]